MPYTLDLTDVGSADLALAGGKGANLGELVRAGFPVPPGFVVTTTAYTEVVSRGELAGASPEMLRERIRSLPLPDDVATAIRAGYRALGSPPVAVRSSGVAEDLADASFAGQHDTFLDVRGDDAVVTAVLDCWASLWNPHAVAYRERAGHDRPDLALAVVVQAMVDAEWAGVLFTADPVTGRRDQLVIEAVRGLGESLVSGAVAGHQHVLTRGAPPPAADSPVPVDVLTELADLGIRVEEAFGAPQDIEWTYADGQCALVQARPLTALPDPEPAPAPAQPMSFRRQQIADHLPYPPYPVDAALMLRPAVRAVTRFLGSAGLAVSPPEEILVEDENGIRVVAPDARPTPRMLLRVPALLPRMVPYLRTSPDEWFARCARTLAPLAEAALADDLSGTSDTELLDRVDAIVRAQAALMPGRFGCAVPRLLAVDPAFKTLLALAVGRDDRDQLYTELMAGIATITRAANQQLAELADTVRRTPALADVYRDHDPQDVPDELRQLAPGRQLLADIARYLDTYGYRQPVTPLPGFETLAETPHRVHGMLKGLASSAADSTAGSGSSRAKAAERSLRQRRGPRARLFGPLALGLAAQARTGVSFREDSHCLAFMLPAAAIRRLLLELGARLVDREAIDAATDVLYLEPHELTTLPPTRQRELATRRKKARDAALALDACRAAGVEGAILGIPASRGVLEGVVRVVRDVDEFGKLSAGEVLVCPYTNPAWTPLFAIASAVVTDGGGAGSHTAIVAREYGIPAVMGTNDATRRLHDGDRVRVDGAAGTVTLLDD